jgi:NAD(P)H-dependent flavin oxidoreductase YrpB (nitropropane dioxygenase family)
MFNSSYPIVCSPMNGVSDLKLAIACAKAGIVPSLIPYTFKSFNDFFQAVNVVLKESNDIHVAISFKDIINNAELIKSSGITHIEILDYIPSDITTANKNIINELRSTGIKILLKVLLPHVIDQFIDIIDAVTVKGSEGAGRSAKDIKLETIIFDVKQTYPGLYIIASGGIKNNNDIKSLLSLGASAVSIGTLFAVSEESPIPKEIKDKLLKTTINDIQRLKNGARQRAVIFDEHAEDDFNNTDGLMSGLQTGSSGHIFIGNAIDSVNEMLSVQQIVDHLVSCQ